MTHPLVDQLRFTRSEFLRVMEDVSAEDAVKRLGPVNCLSWMVGHLADQEQRYWVSQVQAEPVIPTLNERVGYGRPAGTPPLDEMWTAWLTITQVADTFLDTLTAEDMTRRVVMNGRELDDDTGTRLLRTIYHYWFHLGEAHAVRQQLGHTNLPQFVGDMSALRR